MYRISAQCVTLLCCLFKQKCLKSGLQCNFELVVDIPVGHLLPLLKLHSDTGILSTQVTFSARVRDQDLYCA